MAPMTRRSQAGGGIAKKQPVRKSRAPVTTRSTSNSWDFVNTDNDEVRETTEMDDDEENAMVNGHMDVEAAVEPLRDVADKVGREVEHFAEELDKFQDEVAELGSKEEKYEAALALVGQFKMIADASVWELKKTHQRDTAEQLRKEWSERAQLSATGSDAAGKSVLRRGGIVLGMKAEKVRELRQWQQESDLWQLFHWLLDYYYNAAARRAKAEEALANLPKPHRYMSENEIWERFTLENETAMERAHIKQWLEQSAHHQESDISAIMEELETKSGAGKGLWHRGWLHTREKIKSEKRVRSWPSPSDSVQPQIRNSAGTDMLVTQLDPDAPTRQQHSLEKQDVHFERAMWIACWEMLRRGKSWEEIVRWCEEHDEGWRAAILLPAQGSIDALSNAAWRKMCYIASESGCSNDWEAAVYGLLGGNLNAVQKICRTPDDHLFAYYSCTLIRQFDQYIERHYPNRSSALAGRRAAGEDISDTKDSAQEALRTLIMQLRGSHSNVREEMLAPLKLVETFLLADSMEDLFSTLGYCISELDDMGGMPEQAILRLPKRTIELPKEAAIVTDSRALLIVAHVRAILLATEGPPPEDTRDAEENVTVAYVQYLRKNGLRDLTPLYAHTLSRGRGTLTMARVFQDVRQDREQQLMLNLLAKTEMDVVAVLEEQLRATIDDTLSRDELPKKPLQILEPCEIGQLSPGERIVHGFLEEEMTEGDVALVKCLQWFQLLKGHWRLTFSALAEGLRVALLTGRLFCATEIIHAFPFEELSSQKSHTVLGRAVNIMDKDLAPIDEDSDAGIQWDILKRQARSYYELEQIVHAIEALSEWVTQERPHTSQPKRTGSVPAELKLAKLRLDEAMAPLLSGILLNAETPEEQHILDRIRETYLPELIISYNTALYTAGPTVTRDAYLDSMDLSVAIADETNGLTECFTKAGRMRELVNIFAQASKMMLVMKANGRPRKESRRGRDLGLWEIGAQVALGASTASDGA